MLLRMHHTGRLYPHCCGCHGRATAVTAAAVQRCMNQKKTTQTQTNGQRRFHHPNPFDPKTTKGWKAAIKVCMNLCVCMCLFNRSN
jgi:hypothetical protein